MAPSVRMKHICVAQATREIVLLCVQRLVSILGSVNRHVADFQKGKIAKEKIHGGLETRVQYCYQKYDAISHQDNYIDE